MELNLKTRVSKYTSYLLRHNPQNLKMDLEGFVDIDELLAKLRLLIPVDKTLVIHTIGMSDKKRFEIRGNKIRALYGHTIPVRIEHEEDKTVRIFYHGTTESAAQDFERRIGADAEKIGAFVSNNRRRNLCRTEKDKASCCFGDQR